MERPGSDLSPISELSEPQRALVRGQKQVSKHWPRTWPRGTTQTSLPTVTHRARGQPREQPQQLQAEDGLGWGCLTGSCALGGGVDEPLGTSWTLANGTGNEARLARSCGRQ